MKKSWSRQIIACVISLIFLLAGIMLSFAVFFTSKTRTLAASTTENYTQPVGRATSSNEIYGYIPFHFSGESKDIVASIDTNTNNNSRYLSYKMRQGDTISYEQDLALSWYEADATNSNGTQKFLRFTFKFADKNFKSVKFTFEAPAVNASKAGKVSHIIEVDKQLNSAGNMVGNVKYNGIDTNETVDLTYEMTLVFRKPTTGTKNSYDVILEHQSSTSSGTIGLGAINNVDGWYSSYRVSDKVTTTPLNIEYTMPDDAQEPSVILIKELNGQNFELNGGNTIVDSTIPVVVPNSSIYHFINGTSFSNNFDYRQIDVLSSTYSTTEYLGIEDNNVTLEDFKKEEKNKVENRSKDIVLTSNIQNPNARAIVSLKKSETEDIDIDLTWYADNQTIPILPPVEDGKMYPTMQWDDTKVKSFQSASVTATGYKEDNSILSMPLGSGAYLYFGALTEIVNNTLTQPNAAQGGQSYTVSTQNILYTIYYRIGETGEVKSSSPAKNNQLRLALTEAGPYQIILVPQYNGVAMQVDGQELDANNVFKLAQDQSNKALLSILNFNIAYSGPEVSNGTSTVSGYVGTTFSGVNIEVIALDNDVYKSWRTYTLYELVAPNKNDLTRDMIVTAMEALRNPTTTNTANNKIAEDKTAYEAKPNDYIGYLREINAYNDQLGENEGDNIYKWRPESGSYTFVPQSESFYVVQVEVKSLSNPATPQYGFQAIDVLSRADINAGHDSSWVQNNLAAIILFSISGALLILLIVLIFLPNKNKQNKAVKHLIGADSVKKEIIIDDISTEFTVLNDTTQESTQNTKNNTSDKIE